MKKCVSILLAAILLMTSIHIGTPKVQAAAKSEKTRAIAIVFDNSGTMYLGNEDSRKTWCRATYAMQALATMMNSSDIMQIYPMNPIQIGNADKPKDSDVYTSERPLEINKANASLIQEICTPYAGDTHIEAVTKAREGLAKTNASEKWLIVLTDGTVFYRRGVELSTRESIRQLTDEFNQSLQQVNAMYLGIGNEAQSGFSVKSDQYQFVERKATNSAQVLAYLTELGNIIFGRDELPDTSDKITFDVSMKKLILFIQGESIDRVALGNLKPTSTNQLKYSTYGAKNYKSLCDTTLQGTMLTYENLDAGSYNISFSGQASDIAVYYEPDVDLDFVFTNADGSAVDPNALYEGEYKVSFGMKDAKTGKLISSKLLGNPHYAGSYFINGQEYPISHDGYSGETPVSLKMNDTFDANLTATYLSGYTITKNSTDFGWPAGGIQVAARPAGDMKLEISGGDEIYSLQNLEEGGPFIAKVYYQGTQLTGSELEKVELKWEPETSNAEITKEFADDHWELFLHYKDPAAPQNTVCGKCTVSIYAFYSAQGSSEAQTQCPLTYNIRDDFSPLQVSLHAPDDYIVIKELEDSKAIIANLTIEGKPLTAEEFSNVKLQADCGGIEYTITPNAQDSSYAIKLLPTDGIGEGDYPIKVTAQFTDQFGRVTETKAETAVTLSAMPLWLKWVIGLLILLLLILLIWMIMHIRRFPKSVRPVTEGCSLRVGGRDVTEDANFFAKSTGKQIVSYVQYNGDELGRVTLNKLSPGKESYLYKSSQKRSFWAKYPESVSVTGEVTAVDVAGIEYVLDKEGRVKPAEEQQAPFAITNGASVTMSGKTMVAGKTKNFNAEIPLNFKKR